MKLKRRHFELGDKPQKLLARQLKGEQAKRAIYKIKSKSGKILTDLKDINECFKEFYSEIYTSKSTQEDFSFLIHSTFQNWTQLSGRVWSLESRDMFGSRQLPPSLSVANICVLLKKDKDETDPGSYRPIALLNYDLKIITKVLAKRKCSKYYSRGPNRNYSGQVLLL